MEHSLFFQNQNSPILQSRLKESNSNSGDPRTAYFSDATAIIHSYPFRRLKHKTQVFFSPKNDHICTRVEHVMHVASIATTICRTFGLNPDLAWAIGLGHDLGHTPFGHAGEKVLSELTGESFSHEKHGLRVVDHLAHRGANRDMGLNLCYAVRDGIVNHCGERFEQYIKPDFDFKNLSELPARSAYPASWEGCIVRFADKIAYLGRDLEDAIALKIITKDDIPSSVKKVLGDNNADIINTLTIDLISMGHTSEGMGFSDDVFEQFIKLKDFNYERIYLSPFLSRWKSYCERLLKLLYDYLLELHEKIKQTNLAIYQQEGNTLARRFADYLKTMEPFYINCEGSFDKAPLDYIAGMSDDFAINSAKEILMPEKIDTF
ncbi:MAG: HD domain-containing protein [Spirochaetaceae bacterium]|nr:HD domain-containing protein [Spirochaetaceae bacterium]